MGKSFTFPISIPGSPRSPGTAGAAGSTTGFGSGRASAGCLASERFRGAGHLGRLRSGRAWSFSTAHHRGRRWPMISMVFRNQAIALGQPSGSPGQGSREFRADGRGPDEVEVPGRVGPVIPLLNIGADGGSSRRVCVKTRCLPAKGLEGTTHRLRAGEQFQKSHGFPRATTKATSRERRPPA